MERLESEAEQSDEGGELDAAYVEAVKRGDVETALRYGWDFRKATKEYLASLAASTDFENEVRGKKITKSPLMSGGTIIGQVAQATPGSNRLSPPNGQMVKDGKGSTNSGTGQINDENESITTDNKGSRW